MFDDDGMEEIKQIFLEESYEGLDVMENGLLNLDLGEADLEVVNNIFRAAHSIKGGGGTFGFMEVSNFTHGVETILDQMRDGQRLVTESVVSLLLESVDCLREMMDVIRDNGEYDDPRISALNARIQKTLESEEAVAAPEPVNEPEPAQETSEPQTAASEDAPQPAAVAGTEADLPQESQATESGWLISFKPHADMLKTGNDPVQIIRALSRLGGIKTEVDTSRLPALDELEPENSYFSWRVTLAPTEASREQVVALFDWVEDECDLSVEPFAAADVDTALEANAADSGSDVVSGNTAEKTSPTSSETEVPSVPSPKAEQQTSTAEPSPAVTSTSTPASVPAAKESKQTEHSKHAAKEGGSIRVNIEKIDSLLNLVGELVITQSMLVRFGKDYSEESLDDLRDGLLLLERNARELQESAMQIRMLPIKVSFSRFPRLVRDLSGKLGKKVDLQTSGENTELDKTVLEKIGDPLVHLVRNSLDHGIETVEERIAAGKPETGVLHLSAYHEAGNIVIAITDDGAGLNRERILAKARERGLVGEDEQLSDDRIDNLIFRPGFSTAEQVSDISGRGVGMDVVRRNINDLGGRVEVRSTPGKGSVFTIRLPLTLAILDGQLVRVAGETYVIPLLSIIESVLIKPSHLNIIANEIPVYQLREEYIPVADLCEIFHGAQGISTMAEEDYAGKLLVVVEAEGRRYGLVVDDLCEQQQVVIKALEANYRHVAGLSGATILGDGKVALIMDIPSLVHTCFSTAEIDNAMKTHMVTA